MKKYKLEFLGYTWDQFFQMIADKQGILVVYGGRLDSEGSVKMESMLSLSWEKRLGDVYDSQKLARIRTQLSANLMLFYSYAEIDEANGTIIVQHLINKLSNQNEIVGSDLKIKCTGACALFPKDEIATT
jgi:hypothetical protein